VTKETTKKEKKNSQDRIWFLPIHLFYYMMIFLYLHVKIPINFYVNKIIHVKIPINFCVNKIIHIGFERFKSNPWDNKKL
jgi:hypothetical protein